MKPHIKFSSYIIFAILAVFAISCDGGGETAGTGGGTIILDDSASGQDTGGSPPANDPNSPGSLNNFQEFMLGVINQVRSQSRNCGNEFFPQAPPLSWDDRIEAAAQRHADDMADSRDLSHTGSDGSNAGDRLLMENYDWFSWGENILFGLSNGENAVNALLDSPSHCSLIMGTEFQQVGAGSANGRLRGASSTFWSIVFATENN